MASSTAKAKEDRVGRICTRIVRQKRAEQAVSFGFAEREVSYRWMPSLRI